mmetsp:Transcript_135/g.500  ORF Transcript_135/g.500 Transcript_135/m.500 type:complete len:306 (+) Transcript_135:224-1141(+)
MAPGSCSRPVRDRRGPPDAAVGPLILEVARPCPNVFEFLRILPTIVLLNKDCGSGAAPSRRPPSSRGPSRGSSRLASRRRRAAHESLWPQFLQSRTEPGDSRLRRSLSSASTASCSKGVPSLAAQLRLPPAPPACGSLEDIVADYDEVNGERDRDSLSEVFQGMANWQKVMGLRFDDILGGPPHREELGETGNVANASWGLGSYFERWASTQRGRDVFIRGLPRFDITAVYDEIIRMETHGQMMPNSSCPQTVTSSRTRLGASPGGIATRGRPSRAVKTRGTSDAAPRPWLGRKQWARPTCGSPA